VSDNDSVTYQAILNWCCLQWQFYIIKLTKVHESHWLKRAIDDV